MSIENVYLFTMATGLYNMAGIIIIISDRAVKRYPCCS